jgi:signal transduction histidine kinase
VGARARSARKLAGAIEAGGDLDFERTRQDTSTLHAKLRELESDVTSLYSEWAAYLRSMQKPVLSVDQFTLNRMLVEVVEAAAARGAGVDIRFVPPVGTIEVAGDRGMLKEALINIVNNAAEACQATQGGVTVAMRPTAESRGTDQTVTIDIVDTGPGVPARLLPRLFSPGFTTKDNGSGIGLAVAERVVVAHRGRISIDSKPGEGTCVTVILPISNWSTVASDGESA